MKVKRAKSDVWLRLRKNKLAMVGLFILLVLFCIALLGDVLFDYQTDVIANDVPNRLQKPSSEHWFGTDGFGRDLFARVLYGTRYSLAVGFITAIGALIAGGALGSLSGYFGGILDTIIMRCLDVLMAIPSVVLAIALVTVLGTGFTNLVIALTVSYVPVFTRLLRSSILSIKNQEYIEAAHCSGVGTARIILRHILPNCMGPIIVQVTFTVATAILSSAGLSFLGVGVEAPAPEWGTLLSEGREWMRQKPYLVVIPGSFIAMTVLALNLAGDGLRDALDPRLKKRSEERRVGKECRL